MSYRSPPGIPPLIGPEQADDIRDWWYGPLQPTVAVIAEALTIDRRIIAKIVSHRYRW